MENTTTKLTIYSKNISTHDVSTVIAINTGSDHSLVRAKMKIDTKLARKKLIKSNQVNNIDYKLLSTTKKTISILQKPV